MELGDEALEGVIDRISPEFFNSLTEVGVSLAGQNVGQIQNRALQARSGGRTQMMVNGYSVDNQVGDSAGENRAAFWVAGSWNKANIDSDDGFIEYEFDSLIGYLGFDYLITDEMLLGIMASFGNTDVKYDYASGSSSDVDSWSISGYYSYFGDNGWYANAGGGWGNLDIETSRDLSFNAMAGGLDSVALAEYDGKYTYFFGEAGYSFDIGENGLVLSPEAGLVYTKVKQDGFEEFGAPVFGLIVDEQSHKSVRGTIQARLSKVFETSNSGIVVPYVRVGIAREFEDDLRAITARFVGDPDGAFTIMGGVPRETTGIFGIGVAAILNDAWSVHFDYSGEIGGNFSNHGLSGSVRIRF